MTQVAQTSADENVATQSLGLFGLAQRWIGDGRRFVQRFMFEPQWFIAIRDARSKHRWTEERHFTLMRPPRGLNYADPFLFEHDGHTHLFFECWEGIHGHGEIAWTELNENGVPGLPEVVLSRSYHLSYPGVFHCGNAIYMLPETKSHMTVELYRALDFPRRWELAAVLLTGMSLVDPTIIEHEGKFWLFAGSRPSTSFGWSELLLFVADSLFGPWRPHPKNPVVRDLRCARPAGKLFLYDGKLIRPGQDGETRYGHAVRLNRVEVLSESAYHEVPVDYIPANWFRGNLGSHTLNRTARWEVIDGRDLIPRW